MSGLAVILDHAEAREHSDCSKGDSSEHRSGDGSVTSVYFKRDGLLAQLLVDQAIDQFLDAFAGLGQDEVSSYRSDQSSLKLVESAEIQIWRAGELGETTNLPGGSSKLMCSAPALSSASKSASPSAS